MKSAFVPEERKLGGNPGDSCLLVEESTREDTSLNRESYYPKTGVFGGLKNGYYKYFWWGVARGGNEFDFFALGNHGQFIYIAPRKNLIIVRNGETFGKIRRQWIEGFQAFADTL